MTIKGWKLKIAESSYLIVFELPASLGVLTFPLLVLGQSEERYHLVRPVDIATFVNLDAISGHDSFYDRSLAHLDNWRDEFKQKAR